MYYLQSRYYNPKTGRFLNADALASTGQGVLGNNVFAYCLNNPENMLDPSGNYGVYWTAKANSQPILSSESDFFKDFLTHMARPRQEGNTFSAGFTGGSSFWGASNSKSGVISVDTSHNYALQETTSLGASAGSGASAGIVMTYTNANNVQDLAGASASYGATLISAAGLSIDYIEFTPASNPKIKCWGVNVVVALGAEAEIHASQNFTTSTASWNPFIELRNLIYGGE